MTITTGTIGQPERCNKDLAARLSQYPIEYQYSLYLFFQRRLSYAHRQRVNWSTSMNLSDLGWLVDFQALPYGFYQQPRHNMRLNYLPTYPAPNLSYVYKKPRRSRWIKCYKNVLRWACTQFSELASLQECIFFLATIPENHNRANDKQPAIKTLAIDLLAHFGVLPLDRQWAQMMKKVH